MKIGGKEYKVVENLGFVHTAGQYGKIVEDGKKERVVVKYPGGNWKFAKGSIRPRGEWAGQ